MQPSENRKPPRRARLFTVDSFKGLDPSRVRAGDSPAGRVFLHVRGLRGGTGVHAKVFELHVITTSLDGRLASGRVSVGGEPHPCDVRFADVRKQRGKPQPVGAVAIGQRGDTPSLMFPWCGVEHLLEAVSTPRKAGA